jgi:hypothetical protein
MVQGQFGQKQEPHLSKKKKNQVWWLKLVTVGEVEIRKIMVQGHQGPKVHETPISTKDWTRWHMHVIPAMWGSTNKKIVV